VSWAERTVQKSRRADVSFWFWENDDRLMLFGKNFGTPAHAVEFSDKFNAVMKSKECDGSMIYNMEATTERKKLNGKLIAPAKDQVSLAIFSLKGATEAVDVISGLLGKQIEPNRAELLPETMPKLEVTRVGDKWVEVRGSAWKFLKKWLLGKKYLAGDEYDDYVQLTPDDDEPGSDNNFYVSMLEDLANKKGFDYNLTVLEAACACAQQPAASARVPRMTPHRITKRQVGVTKRKGGKRSQEKITDARTPNGSSENMRNGRWRWSVMR
jgi:hypothetical protein